MMNLPAKLDVKQRLARAAIDAIVAEGWLGAGSRSITSRAGVPLGALNYHFISKDHLLRQAAMDEIAVMFAQPRAAIATASTLGDLIDKLVGWTALPNITSTQQALLLEIMTQTKRDPVLAADLEQALSDYRAALRDALMRLHMEPGRAGTWPDVVETAAALVAHCNGLWLQGAIEPNFPIGLATAAAAALWKNALGITKHQQGPED